MSIFSVHSTTDDVEIVMKDVAEALRRWEGGEARPLDISLLQGRVEDLTQHAHQLRLQWNIDGNAIIHSTRPGLGPWIIRFQLLVRRLTWWFLEPILQQIRVFQMNAALIIDGLAQNQEALAAQAIPGGGCEEQLKTLEHRIEELHRRLDALEREHAG